MLNYKEEENYWSLPSASTVLLLTISINTQRNVGRISLSNDIGSRTSVWRFIWIVQVVDSKTGAVQITSLVFVTIYYDNLRISFVSTSCWVKLSPEDARCCWVRCIGAGNIDWLSSLSTEWWNWVRNDHYWLV